MKQELLIEGLSALTPFRAAGCLIVEHRVRNMMAHEQGVRTGEDIEALHDMRVYSRRLREALRIFEGCCRKKKFKKVSRRVRDITRSLGEVRNLDVFLVYFNDFLEEAGGDENIIAASEKLISWGERRREKLRKAMLEQLDEIRPDTLYHDVIAAILPKHFTLPAPGPVSSGTPSDDAQSAPSPIPLVAAVAEKPSSARYSVAYNTRRLLQQRIEEAAIAWTSVQKATGSRSEELHALRIAFKKLRYALEILYAAFDFDKLSKIYEIVKTFQDILGDIHDNDVFAAIVTSKRKKAEKKEDAVLAAGYFKISARMVTRRHELFQAFNTLAAEYPIDVITRETNDAFLPVTRQRGNLKSGKKKNK